MFNKIVAFLLSIIISSGNITAVPETVDVTKEPITVSTVSVQKDTTDGVQPVSVAECGVLTIEEDVVFDTADKKDAPADVQAESSSDIEAVIETAPVSDTAADAVSEASYEPEFSESVECLEEVTETAAEEPVIEGTFENAEAYTEEYVELVIESDIESVASNDTGDAETKTSGSDGVAMVSIECAPVKNYVENEVIALCESEFEAGFIAFLYDITLKNFSYGVAVYDTEGMDPVDVIEKGKAEGYPEVSLNHTYSITDPVKPITVDPVFPINNRIVY